MSDIREPDPGDWMDREVEGRSFGFLRPLGEEAAFTVLVQQCRQPSMLPAIVWTGQGDSGHELRPPVRLGC